MALDAESASNKKAVRELEESTRAEVDELSSKVQVLAELQNLAELSRSQEEK